MASKIKNVFAQQLRSPTKGVLGWIAANTLKYQNRVLEKNAVRLCAIEPDHKVLQIGFGLGTGVQYALLHVKDGPGKVCGVDISPYMVEKASSKLHKHIQEGKVQLGLGDVRNLPYATHSFHRAFHCCCYYLWPSMQDALEEIHRVMKPGGMMVTMLDLRRMQKYQAQGQLKYRQFDPLKYMCALELTGFQDVRIEYFTDSSATYQAIFAHLPTQLLSEHDLRDLKNQGAVDNLNDAGSASGQNKSVHVLHSLPDAVSVEK